MAQPTTSSVSNVAPRRRRGASGGFTLVEMLVVIGMIAVLAAIIVPAVGTAMRHARRTRMAADLQTIASALEVYKQDNGDYPRVNSGPPNPVTGAQVLCRALYGPGNAAQDGHDGFGFAVRQGGQVFGPYLRVGQFKIGDPNAPDSATPNPLEMCLLDGNNKPILYYPARPGPVILAGTINGASTFISGGSQSVFNFTDNYLAPPKDYVSNSQFMAVMGDLDLDGKIMASETAASTGPFVLWTAGPDGKFGPPDDQLVTGGGASGRTKNAALVAKCDDVTNFR